MHALRLDSACAGDPPTWTGGVTTGTVSQHSVEIEIGQIKRVTLVGVGNIVASGD